MSYKWEAFPPLKIKNGANVFILSCGHFCQTITKLNHILKCPICELEVQENETINIPTTKSHQCWSCEMWVGDIKANKIYVDKNCSNEICCPNCGSYILIKNSNNKRDPIETRLRHEVFKRDNYKCLECGKGKKETTLHCDHIMPVAQGGSDELDNLQTLCQACNLAKTNRKWNGGKK